MAKRQATPAIYIVIIGVDKYGDNVVLETTTRSEAVDTYLKLRCDECHWRPTDCCRLEETSDYQGAAERLGLR